MVFNGSKFHIKPYNVAIHRWQCRRIPASSTTFPSSRLDENHAQIHCDTNGKDDGDVERRAYSCSPLPTKLSIDIEDTTHLSSLNDFFHDNPNISYMVPPEHVLEQSPCRTIVVIKQGYFYCRLHPDIKNVHLELVELEYA